MNKKGQIYILAALIIIAVFFGLVSRVNIFTEQEVTQEFSDISDNYAIESNKFLNSLINSPNLDVPEAFANFTFLFTAYSKSKNPGYGLIYAFEYEDKIHIGNYLDRPITLIYKNSDKENVAGCYELVPSSISFEGITLQVDAVPLGELEECTKSPSESDEITIVIGGTSYKFQTEQDYPQLIIVSKLDKEEQRRVFLEGEMLEAGESTAAEDVCLNSPGSSGCVGSQVDCKEIYKFSPTGCAKSPHCILTENEQCIQKQ